MTQQPFHKKESQALVDSTALPAVDTPEESIPRAVVPYNRDDDRSRYLGLRASGFTIREALGLIGKAKSTLSLWRHDEVFTDLENRIPELRKTLALEYASLEFLRNYRLVLEKDFRVIKGSLKKETFLDSEGKPRKLSMDSQDFQYLLKLRAHYTPQQLQAIEQVLGAESDKGSLKDNWTDLVLSFSRKTEEVRVETRHRQEPVLSPIIEGEAEEIVLSADVAE